MDNQGSSLLLGALLAVFGWVLTTAIEEAKNGSVLVYEITNEREADSEDPFLRVSLTNASRRTWAGPFAVYVKCKDNAQPCFVPDRASVSSDALAAPVDTQSGANGYFGWMIATIPPSGGLSLKLPTRFDGAQADFLVSQEVGDRPPNMILEANSLQGRLMRYWFELLLTTTIIIFAMVAFLLAPMFKKVWKQISGRDSEQPAPVRELEKPILVELVDRREQANVATADLAVSTGEDGESKKPVR